MDKKINKKDEVLNKYKTQLQLDTINAKNEANVANRKANEYLQNYLKSQGIANTGLGMSNYTNLASNYANTLANIQANANQDLRNYEQQYETNRVNQIQNELASMDATKRAQAYQNFVNTEGLSSTANQSLQSYYNTLNNQEINNIVNSDLSQMSQQQYYNYLNQLQNNPNVTQSQIDAYKQAGNTYGLDITSNINNEVNALRLEANKATNENEYNAYKDAISKLESITSKYPNDVNKQMEEYAKVVNEYQSGGGINAVDAKSSSFGDFLGGDGGNQSFSIDALMKQVVEKPNEYDGKVFNMNYGAGTPSYYRYDASTQKWYYIGKEYKGKSTELKTWYNKYRLGGS